MADEEEQNFRKKILAALQRVKDSLAKKKDSSPERAAAVAAEPVVAVPAKKPKLTHDSLPTAAKKLKKVAQDEIQLLCSSSDARKKLEKAVEGIMSVNELFPNNVKDLPTSSGKFSSYMVDVSKFANSPDFCAVMANLRETVKFAMVLALKLNVELFLQRGMMFALLRLFICLESISDFKLPAKIKLVKENINLPKLFPYLVNDSYVRWKHTTQVPKNPQFSFRQMFLELADKLAMLESGTKLHLSYTGDNEEGSMGLFL